ncbi:hypothetical protein SAMN05216262_102247 [Colwellia chukchiensis]|uniref:YebG protein n=1 Tax=Colwellia chukchiensis TaxID=641665 RepID=A0A1H7JIN8_9GAMM|nr:YebG family protein [Colwellia chukchiensis]SEK74256.1 hypothetical protein SAMN05216262_102247 [Colwellia chukchiensis]
MAVESRFVVIRQGVEVETFMDKKAADEYDKMLDMADNLAEMFAQAPVDLSEGIREELSIYLAQNRDHVLVALQAKKAKAVTKKVAQVSKNQRVSDNPDDAQRAIPAESEPKTSAKSSAKKAAKTKPASKAKAALA